jgi:hypothetical protein
MRRIESNLDTRTTGSSKALYHVHSHIEKTTRSTDAQRLAKAVRQVLGDEQDNDRPLREYDETREDQREELVEAMGIISDALKRDGEEIEKDDDNHTVEDAIIDANRNARRPGKK